MGGRSEFRETAHERNITYTTPAETIAATVTELLGERARSITVARGEVTLVVAQPATIWT